MGSVVVERTFAAEVELAEATWYELEGWPHWVDGLERVEAVEGDWPHAGAVVRWRSTPAGRGAVCERVISHEPGGGQTIEVVDDSIEGLQSVAFAPIDDGLVVRLGLNYRLRRHPVLMWPVDRLFIAGAMHGSLRATLDAFGAWLARRG